ncbi:MAG: class I SAM-dependent methyltransferase [Bacteroidales bacterium]|nr:class I SAM-dependent methyltransferase [Bacteroidales bacterium]
MEDIKLVKIENCIFCKSSEYKIYDSLDGWEISECRSCRYIFTNPRPSDEDLQSFYDFDYFKDTRHHDKFFNSDGSVKSNVEDYYNRIKDIEKWFSTRGKLLELGSAHGDFLYKMTQRGWETYGIEISVEAVELALMKNNLKIFNGTFEDFETDKKFDVICMYQTLEHVKDPKYVIEKAFRLLNKNGILVIEVPNVKAFDLRISKKRKWLSYDLPRHLSHFSPSFLKKRLLENSFTILETDLYYPEFVLKLFNWQHDNKRKAVDKINTEPMSNNENAIHEMLKDHTTWKGSALKKFSRLFPGWKFTIIAKK